MEIIIDENFANRTPRYYPVRFIFGRNPLEGRRVLPVRDKFLNNYKILIFQYYDENVNYELQLNEHIVYEFNLNEVIAINVIESEAEELRQIANEMESYLELRNKIRVFNNNSYTGTASAPRDWY